MKSSTSMARAFCPLVVAAGLLCGQAHADTNVIDKIDNVVDKVENAYNTANGKLQRVETSVKRIDNAVFKGKVKTITQRRITRKDSKGRVVELNRTGVIGKAHRATGAAREVGIILRELKTWQQPGKVEENMKSVK